MQWIADQKRPLFILLLITLLVRLAPMLLLPVGARYDIDSFQLVGEALLRGEDIYTSPARTRHPYLPLQMYWIGMAWWGSLQSGLPLAMLVKIAPLLADIGLTALIFVTYRRWQKGLVTAVSFALLYALNPVSLLVSAYHGQFDAISVLLLGLAWFTWHFGRRLGQSSAALGFAILNKTWPVVFLPIVLIRLHSNRQRLIYTLIAVGIPMGLILFYLWVFQASPAPLLRRALLHTGVANYWGVSAILDVTNKITPFFAPAAEFYYAGRRFWLLLVGLLLLWATRRQSALDALLTIILGEFVVTAGLGIQWLLWIVPFAILAGQTRWLTWYTLTALLMMLAQLYGLHLYPWSYQLLDQETATILIQLTAVPAWIVVLLWSIQRLKIIRLSQPSRFSG